VVADPSHGTGIGAYVPALARAAAAAGAHGVMFEIHDHPEHALSDGQQAIAPEGLPALVRDLRRIAEIVRAAEGEEE
jgi:3-deoxy-7-phosphoheptulonate synthase